MSRTRHRPANALAFAESIARLPHLTVVPLTAELVEASAQLAARHSLRGADAVYAAVDLSAQCALISLDTEPLTRLRGVVGTPTPAAALEAI